MFHDVENKWQVRALWPDLKWSTNKNGIPPGCKQKSPYFLSLSQLFRWKCNTICCKYKYIHPTWVALWGVWRAGQGNCLVKTYLFIWKLSLEDVYLWHLSKERSTAFVLLVNKLFLYFLLMFAKPLNHGGLWFILWVWHLYLDSCWLINLGPISPTHPYFVGCFKGKNCILGRMIIS